ncbi:exported hypothetical protein [uncultured Alphaproteobacteria bacterium]|uniref:Autotransporter domain-containing protein n=1 Tax=uncultured Alphaproteobacteria bacterium TaxID=91750 RepID=A0A212JH05_9PROT|nr:exported hypothetical protein [uncultured Alphaproteobacteria bacterium]
MENRWRPAERRCGWKTALVLGASWPAFAAMAMPTAFAADWTIDTPVAAAQTLGNGDNGVITADGSITVTGGAALQTPFHGTPTSLTNAGTISMTNGDGYYNNGGTLGSLVNSGTLSAVGSGRAIDNTGTIVTLTNTGTISASGTARGIYVSGTSGAITTLNNSGTISADREAIYANWNTAIGTLTNSGTISGGTTGLHLEEGGFPNVGGVLNTLLNSGTISGGTTAIRIGAGYSATFIGGTLGSLTNSGTISAPTAILVAVNGSYYGNLGTVTNTGAIAGDITSALGTLNLVGGSGDAEGVLTGYPAASETVGTITGNRVNFLSGALLLNDNVISTLGTSNAAILRIKRNIFITGPYVQTGTLVVEVAADGTYGKLTTTGAATLDGGTVRVTGDGIAANASYTVLTAGTTLSADNLVLVVGGYSGNSYRIDGTNLIVTLGQKAQWADKGVAAGPATAGLGAALDDLGSDTRFADVFSALGRLSDGGQIRALRQMAPDRMTTQLNLSGATLEPATMAIQNRQLARMDGNGASGVATGEAPADRAVWGRVLGGHADQDGADGYSARTAGLLIGADGYLADDLLTGGAISWVRAVARGKGDAGGSRTTLDSFQMSGYATWRPDGGPAYFQGLAGLGRNLYDQRRDIDYLDAAASASYDGWQFQGKMGGGYDVRLGAATVTPLATLQVVRVETDGYSETGAGVANLSVDSNGFNSIQSELGAQLSGGLADTGWGALQGDARLAWVHDYAHAPIAISASMGGVGFVSETDRPARNGARLDLGTTLERNDGLSVSLEYQGELRSAYQSHTGMLTLRSEF